MRHSEDTDGEEKIKADNGGTVDIDAMIKNFTSANGDNGEGPSSGPSQLYATEVLKNIGQDEAAECPICFDVMQYPMIIPGCLHQW